MIVKRIIFGILIALVGVIIIGTIYLFNDDKFYAEYWLQRRIDSLSKTDDKVTIGQPKEIIRYTFYYDPSIDLSIELDDVGNLILKRHDWFPNNKERRSYNLSFDKDKFKMMKEDFKTRWTESITKDADYKFGGIYYVLEFQSFDYPEQNIDVAFYNLVPDKTFMSFKDMIIQIARRELAK